MWKIEKVPTMGAHTHTRVWCDKNVKIYQDRQIAPTKRIGGAPEIEYTPGLWIILCIGSLGLLPSGLPLSFIGPSPVTNTTHNACNCKGQCPEQCVSVRKQSQEQREVPLKGASLFSRSAHYPFISLLEITTNCSQGWGNDWLLTDERLVFQGVDQKKENP